MTSKKLSHLIERQFPFFVRNDHPQFVAFVKSWLEYNEQEETTLSEGKVLERFKSLPDYLDIDTTHSELEEKFFTWFLESFPPETMADRTIILKSAQDFLRARGTEKSTKFLLRAVLGIDDVDVYYPKIDILHVSAGKWYVQKSLRVRDFEVDGVSNNDISGLNLYISAKVKGLTSNATAIVESADRYFDTGQLVDEITITNIVGNFDTSETITANVITDSGVVVLTANVYGGRINEALIYDGGEGYSDNTLIPIEDTGGSGAVLRISEVTSGGIESLQVLTGGSGFHANDSVVITGGGGIDANAYVFTVDETGNLHPNTYNIYSDLIIPEANVLLSNTTYTTLMDANANTILADAFSSFVYANVGPINLVEMIATGNNYTSTPTIFAVANTRVKSLGIMGSLSINDGGTAYANGDIIEFNNQFGGSIGIGANATVEVNATGTIVGYDYTPGGISGYPLGGLGYDQSLLPTLNVATTTGSGANLTAVSVLGFGDTYSETVSQIGTIRAIQIISGGEGYIDPQANLIGYGDGTANVQLGAVEGIFEYPGRYIDSDDLISGYSFIEDQDYYQNFSYVIRTAANLEDYGFLVDKIITPAGVILFSDYMLYDNTINSNANIELSNVEPYITVLATYQANGDNIKIDTTGISVSHNLVTGNTVTLEFVTGDVANLDNTIVAVSSVSNTTVFNVVHDTANSDVETSGSVWAQTYIL